jgi:hypothetical protein
MTHTVNNEAKVKEYTEGLVARWLECSVEEARRHPDFIAFLKEAEVVLRVVSTPFEEALKHPEYDEYAKIVCSHSRGSAEHVCPCGAKTYRPIRNVRHHPEPSVKTYVCAGCQKITEEAF